jgi:hypothetical protein
MWSRSGMYVSLNSRIQHLQFFLFVELSINLVNLLIDHIENVRVLKEQLGIALRTITSEVLSCLYTEINL